MKAILEQLRSHRHTIIFFYVPVIIVLILIQFQNIVPYNELTKDRASLIGIKLYWGLLSNIGILIWTATAAICLFSYFLLKKEDGNKFRTFFLFAGIFSLILAIDDFFFFHDIIFPQMLGIYEELVFLVYFLITVIFLVRFKDIIIKKTDNIFLLFAIIFFVSSLIVDIATHNSFTKHFTFDLHHMLEDGPKLLGIMSWFIYFTRTAYKQILKRNTQTSVSLSDINSAGIKVSKTNN